MDRTTRLNPPELTSSAEVTPRDNAPAPTAPPDRATRLRSCPPRSTPAQPIDAIHASTHDRPAVSATTRSFRRRPADWLQAPVAVFAAVPRSRHCPHTT